jgi:hypothetical protein
MSKRDAVVLVSRALALYLLCWSFSEFTYMPTTLFSLSHHVGQRSVLRSSDYFSDYDVLSVALRAVRLVILLGVAIWLYNCGSSTKRYFWHNNDVPKEPDTREAAKGSDVG